MDTPDTIRNPERFNEAKPAGFDGVFDWKWTQGCFGDTKISPMDLDGIVERRGYFFIFETKDVGVPLPTGQKITLNSLHKALSPKCAIMVVYGKLTFESAKMKWLDSEWYDIRTVEEARRYIKEWFDIAST